VRKIYINNKLLEEVVNSCYHLGCIVLYEQEKNIKKVPKFLEATGAIIQTFEFSIELQTYYKIQHRKVGEVGRGVNICRTKHERNWQRVMLLYVKKIQILKN
jgi:hypothetical protein